MRYGLWALLAVAILTPRHAFAIELLYAGPNGVDFMARVQVFQRESQLDLDGDGSVDLVEAAPTQLRLPLSVKRLDGSLMWQWDASSEDICPSCPQEQLDRLSTYFNGFADASSESGKEAVISWVTDNAHGVMVVSTTTNAMIQNFVSLSFEEFGHFRPESDMDLVLIRSQPAYRYEIWGRDFETSTLDPNGSDTDSTQAAAIMWRSYPNPTAKSATLAFEATKPGLASVEIVDAQGRSIRKLTKMIDRAGPQSLEWDGRSMNGHPVPSGLYYCTIDLGGAKSTRHVVIAR